MQFNFHCLFCRSIFSVFPYASTGGAKGYTLIFTDQCESDEEEATSGGVIDRLSGAKNKLFTCFRHIKKVRRVLFFLLSVLLSRLLINELVNINHRIVSSMKSTTHVRVTNIS